MDGRELREAVLREHSGGGTPYEVEVWYDDAGEQFFKGGWSRFAEDHDLHQGFFIAITNLLLLDLSTQNDRSGDY
jgi:hypothetical protein